MSASNAVVTPGNLTLTPCRVTFNGVDLGATLGNVTISPKYSKVPLKADQFGDQTDIDYVVNGFSVTVETEIAETALKDNWKVVFPNGRLVTSGGNKAMYFENMVGDKDSSHAAVLLLHPLSNVDGDLSQDHKFYKAVASAESQYVFSPNTQGKLKIVWRVLPDTGVVPPRFYFYGDPAVGLTNASAGSPSYSGTGNGTMSPVAVYNGTTKTENIIATCVTAVANGGVFEVHGSVSGPLGLATVGIGFVAPGNQISFTINDGSTDFIVGDQFTVATVAANYV